MLHEPGWYKIVYKNMGGVGYCRHRRRFNSMEPYEEWQTLVLHESGRAVSLGVPQGSQFLRVIAPLRAMPT